MSQSGDILDPEISGQVQCWPHCSSVDALVHLGSIFLQGRKGEYEAFLGENVEDYLTSMEKAGTWGDELTLVHVL